MPSASRLLLRVVRPRRGASRARTRARSSCRRPWRCTSRGRRCAASRRRPRRIGRSRRRCSRRKRPRPGVTRGERLTAIAAMIRSATTVASSGHRAPRAARRTRHRRAGPRCRPLRRQAPSARPRPRAMRRRSVAEAVVHGLEVVEVDEQHRELAAVALEPRRGVVDAVAEERLVGQARSAGRGRPGA